MISGSHSGGYEEYYLLGYNAVESIESQLMETQGQPDYRREDGPSGLESQ
jgi:hypothetical protein